MRSLVIALTLSLWSPLCLAESTSEGTRQGSAYFQGRSGTSWSYADGKGRARLVIDRVENWASYFHVEWGKRSTSGTWRVRDGAWVEKLATRAEETVVLPAVVAVGTRWSGAPSIERGGPGTSQFEVISLDATVELPTGSTQPGCVAVLETGPDGDRAVTHFYAPGSGQVAAQTADGWLLRLLELRISHRGGD